MGDRQDRGIRGAGINCGEERQSPILTRTGQRVLFALVDGVSMRFSQSRIPSNM